MPGVAVFDSGLGSLSVIGPLRRRCGAALIYLADTASFPYGSKSPSELGDIIGGTLGALRARFAPDLIVMASNTPSLVLDIADSDVVSVRPPLREAAAASKSGRIGVLATGAAVRSGGLGRYAASQDLGGASVTMIDGSRLVGLVEDGTFVSDPASCRRAIRATLEPVRRGGIDAVTLSSTHLPFLATMIAEELPGVALVDPAESVAREVAGRLGPGGPGTMEVYSTGDPGEFRRKLLMIGMGEEVMPFSSGTRG